MPAPVPVDRLGELGPYFTLVTGVDPGEGWTPAAVLTGRPELLDAAVARTADRLGTDLAWVAASLWYQGWAARLTALYAGSLALAGVAPDLGAGTVQVKPGGPGPLTPAVTRPEALDATAAWDRLTADHLTPLAAALGRRVSVGRRLLAGAVASSLAGALVVLAQAGHGPLGTLIDRPWAHPDGVNELGGWATTPARPAPRYRRTTCCGYDRVPGGGRCGDCSLTR